MRDERRLAGRLCALVGVLSACVAGAAAAAAFDLQGAVRGAAEGAVIHVPAGRYPAPLVVDRPVTLVADPGAFIDGGGRGDLVHIRAPGAVLRGFALRGSGDSLDRENAGIVVSAPRVTVEDNDLQDVLLGIVLRDAHESQVRRNRVSGKPLAPGRRGDGIRLWNSHDCRIEANTIRGVRDLVIWYSRGTHIVGNCVTEGRYGLHFMYAHGSVIEDNRLTDNSVGIYLMYSADVVLKRNVLAHNRGPSGYGLGLKDMDAVTVEDNVIAANRVGVYLDNSPQRIDGFDDFRRNVIAYNDVGLALLPSVQRNRFVENAFVENVEQLAVLGSGDLQNNAFTIAGRGNYWSDYLGYDADGDGVGDLPYRGMSLFENLMDREPKLRLFLYSPAATAVEFASRAFPIVRPRPKVRDDAPLMTPIVVAPRAAAALPPGSAGLAAAGATLVAALVALRRRIASGRRAAPGAARGAAGAAARPTPASLGAAGQPGRVPLLSTRGLRKLFGRATAVEAFDLDLFAGEAVALWGGNGAGKTTILKCLLGLHSCRGAVCVAGLDARRNGKAARRQIGYVSQELAFHDDLTARDVVRFFARLRLLAPRRGDEVLAQVGLAPHAHKRVAALSGGMKQRLALAVALLSDPPLLLLDEPTSNLDAAARRELLALLAELKAAGKTILFTTHRADEVAHLADRVVVLERGRVVREAAPAELGGDCRVRLVVPADRRDAACESLVRAGFDSARNCSAVLVRVAAARNAAPLAHLARAGFVVESIEIETGEPHE